jgi:exosortase family protein XrtF
MKKLLAENPVLRFLVIAISLYLLWFIVDLYFIKPYTGLDRFLSLQLVYASAFLLSFFGYVPVLTIATEEVVIDVEGSTGMGVWVGEPCNGLALFSLFVIFIIAYPGKWKYKAWYIPLGIIAIHLINIVRVSILTLIAKDHAEYLDINHNYTFTILVYSFVFVLWYWWSVKWSKKT